MEPYQRQPHLAAMRMTGQQQVKFPVAEPFYVGWIVRQQNIFGSGQ